MGKTALITGATGQDGAYLARLLLQKNYKVHAMRQPMAVPDLVRLENISPAIDFHYGDMSDAASVFRMIAKIKPDEIYNLAAQSHVHISFDTPELTAQVNALGVMRLLEAIRIIDPKIKLFQASTSELFGDTPAPQNEASIMNPRSPYAAAKKYAYDMVRIYREAYGLFACNGIMFNHESSYRGQEFVTRKISIGVGKIKRGEKDCLFLGNLDARRDWSHAEDIVRGAWMMMQQERANDFILSSGQSRTVREFAAEAFHLSGFELRWQGEGINEIGIDQHGVTRVVVDTKFYRPLEVESLQGDAAKARQMLGWQLAKTFKDIVREMVEADG